MLKVKFDAILFGFRICAMSILVLTFAGCGENKAKAPTQSPPAEVTVVTVMPTDIPAVFEFVGKTESSRRVQIHARVEGFLEKRMYTEGSTVKEGQLLFLMDKKPFEARLTAAKAALAEQQARLRTTQANLNRVKPLAAQHALSQKDLDDATGQQQAAAAAVEAARADVINAELNLGYTSIHSPVAGVSSFAQVQDGTYVNASNSLLTTVSALSPMRVNFSVSENQLLGFRDEEAAGRLKSPGDQNFEVEVLLADGSTFKEQGKITFADAEFSQSTGTFLIRADFKNADGILRPGQFVRVRLHGAVRPQALLVPKRAVQQGAQGSFVWVISKEGKAELRPVMTGEWHGDDWIIKQGLHPGDTVAVDGAIRLRPEALVKVIESPAKHPEKSGGVAVGEAQSKQAQPAGGGASAHGPVRN